MTYGITLGEHLTMAASASMFYIAIDFKIIIIIIINIINNFFFVGIIVFRPKKLIKASYKPSEMKFL